MMRRYETIFISDPDLSDEQRGLVETRIRELVPQFGGLIVNWDEWGVRKLSYEIRKRPRGFYVRLDYCGDGPLVDELERSFRIDDRILKYLTVKLEDDVDEEKIRSEVEAMNADTPAATEAGKDNAATEEAAGETAESSDAATEAKED